MTDIEKLISDEIAGMPAQWERIVKVHKDFDKVREVYGLGYYDSRQEYDLEFQTLAENILCAILDHNMKEGPL